MLQEHLQRSAFLNEIVLMLDNWIEVMLIKKEFPYNIKNVPSDKILLLEVKENALVIATTPHVSKALQELVKEHAYEHVIINLENVQHIDSSGIGLFFSLAKAKKSYTLYLYNMKPYLLQTMKYTVLESIIHIADSLEAIKNLIES